MNQMLNMTQDHKSPLNHRPIQQGESISRDAPKSTSDSYKMATSEDEAVNP